MAHRSSSTGRYYIFGPFRFDISRQQLYRDGQPVELARRLERTLHLLLENRGRDLEKSYLMEQLWPNTVVEENNLTAIISMLRKALGDDAEHKKFILTNPGRGYRFVADVIETDRAEGSDPVAVQPTDAAAKDVAPSGLQASDPMLGETPASAGHSSFRRSSWRWGAIGAAILLISTVFGLQQWSQRNAKQTIAVLPFQSLGAANDSELGLGMADALITRLRNSKDVVVRPTADVVIYQNQVYDPIAVGKELKVVSLVDGTVQRRDDQLWLRVKLLRVKDGAILWSGEYHGRFADVLRLQDQIAEQATRALALKFNSVGQRAIDGHVSGNPEAHQAYLVGREKCSRNARSALQLGAFYFQRATAKDPQFALAYAGLAACFIQLAEVTEPTVRPDFLAKGKAAAERALAIDPGVREAYLPLALALTYYDWNYPEAEAAFQKSIALAPEVVATHVEYAAFLLSQGRFAEAEREAHRAAELDPLSWSAERAISTVDFIERRYDKAAERLERAREFAPESAPAYLAWIYTSEGRPSSVSYELVRTQAENPTNPRRAFYANELAYLYALKGMKAEARSVLESLQQYPDRNNVDEYETSLVYVALGDRDDALRMLDRAKENRSNEVILVSVDPRFDSIRSDPRFQDFIRSIHLKR